MLTVIGSLFSVLYQCEHTYYETLFWELFSNNLYLHYVSSRVWLDDHYAWNVCYRRGRRIVSHPCEFVNDAAVHQNGWTCNPWYKAIHCGFAHTNLKITSISGEPYPTMKSHVVFLFRIMQRCNNLKLWPWLKPWWSHF